MFDNIYVLAKGGICVYSGRPQNLKTHLNECDVECNQFQFPIEIVLKVCSEGTNNKNVKQLSRKTSEMLESMKERCNNELNLSSDGITLISKRFIVIDLWTLLLRTMTFTYISQWKASLTQIIIFIALGVTFRLTYNSNIAKPDGCLDFSFALNGSCQFLQIFVTIMTFSTDFKIYANEHKDGMSFVKEFHQKYITSTTKKLKN